MLNKRKNGQHRWDVGEFHYRIKIYEKESNVYYRTKQTKSLVNLKKCE